MKVPRNASGMDEAGNRDAASVLVMHVLSLSDRPSRTHFLRGHARPSPSAVAAHHDGASIEAATPNGANERDASLIARAETLLDRAHFSPGEIDGLDGDNCRSAIRAFQQARSLPATGELDPATWSALSLQAGARARGSTTPTGPRDPRFVPLVKS